MEVDSYAPPQVEVLYNGISISNILVDGGVVVNIMRSFVMNMLQLKINCESTQQLRSLNKGKIKLEGVISNIAILFVEVTCLVDFQVIKDGSTTYSILLGSSWLSRVHDCNCWNEGNMIIG